MAAFYEEVIGDGSSDSRLVLFGTCDPAQLPATVATGECVLFQDSTDSNKPKLKFGTTVIDLTTVGGGETNTGSNQGTDGVGVYDTKSGQDLQFRHIAPGSTKITVALNGKDIDLDIAEANIVHQNLSGAGTNTHAQIDTAVTASTSHIADTANPHSVNAAQVGADAAGTATAAVSAHAAAGDPHTGYQLESGKNAVSGYAGLDGSSKLTGSQQVYGTGANTACEGDDSRLSDARTPTAHNHAASEITSGTLPDARVAASNVTQHQAALSITESQISDLSHDDATAVHTDGSAEISALTEKVTPVSGDHLIIEDSAASNAKKRVQVGNLPASGGAADFTDLGDVPASYTGEAGKLVRVNATPDGLEFVAAAGSDTSAIHSGDTAGGDLGGTYPNPTVDDGADGTAIHDNVAGEIGAITEKVTPASADLLVIEDSAAAGAKKRLQIGNLPTGGGGEANTATNQGTDGVGVYDTKAGVELQFRHVAPGSSKVTTTLNGKDIDVDVVEANLTITESQISDLDHTDASAVHDDVAGEIAAVTLKATPAGADVVLIEDSAAANVKKRTTAAAIAASGAPAAHTIASHSDTTATGAELETLTDGSNADSLHSHAVPSHTVASHSDTTATGAELETLTDGSNADALHVHDTAGLADEAVTLAKMANMATASFVARSTAATGVPEVVSAAAARTILNVEDGAAADQSAAEVAFTPDGDIASSTVQAAVVEVRDDTDSKLAGKAASSHTHVEADISDLGTYQPTSEKNAANGYAGLSAGSKLTGSQQTYGTGVNTACEGNDSRLSDSRAPNGSAGGDLTGTYPNPTIGSGNVSLAKMADLAADRIIGRANGAGTGAPTALTAAQVRTILGLRSLIETCREKDWDFSFSDCAVNVPADGGPDTNNAAIDSIKFDNSTEEGRHITVHVPTWATGLKLTTKSHADGAGGGTAAMRLYERELGASITAWSTAISLGNVTSGTDENYDSTEFDNTLATLGLTAGSTHQLQLTRNGGTLSTDLEVVAVTLEWYE